MKFELGKAYKHNTGREVYVCGIAQTIGYGVCLIVEEGGYTNLLPFGMDEDAASNWNEMSKDDFINNNFS